MARTPSKRWDTQIEKEYQKWMKGSRVDGWLFISRALLSRQHASFVRLVKKQRESQKFPPLMQNSWYQAACDDILAALQQGGTK